MTRADKERLRELALSATYIAAFNPSVILTLLDALDRADAVLTPDAGGDGGR